MLDNISPSAVMFAAFVAILVIVSIVIVLQQRQINKNNSLITGLTVAVSKVNREDKTLDLAERFAKEVVPINWVIEFFTLLSPLRFALPGTQDLGIQVELMARQLTDGQPNSEEMRKEIVADIRKRLGLPNVAETTPMNTTLWNTDGTPATGSMPVEQVTIDVGDVG